MGAGASPVREALSLLTSDQLVERIDQRGFRVSLINLKTFEELLKTRCWLEERALRESIGSNDVNWEERLILAHHRLKRAARSVDKNNFVLDTNWEELHKKFHMTLLSACGSSILIKICEQLYDQNKRYRNIAGTNVTPKRDVTGEHDAIIQHVLDKDADKATVELIQHYKKTGELLAQQLK
ncbi:MAG: GntR family transcriptional regulator [Sneathiella sp.]|nr:GntR family transcriptional regulator [Sneathiella sp.]